MLSNKRCVLRVVATSLVLMFYSVVNAENLVDHPKNFTTRNYTPYQSNAKILHIWSPYPTPPAPHGSYSQRSVPWIGLRVFCGPTATECGAKIYMKTDTNNPLFVGEGRMNMKTGEINPKRISGNGFVLTSPEPATIEIREEEK